MSMATILATTLVKDEFWRDVTWLVIFKKATRNSLRRSHGSQVFSIKTILWRSASKKCVFATQKFRFGSQKVYVEIRGDQAAGDATIGFICDRHPNMRFCTPKVRIWDSKIIRQKWAAWSLYALSA